MNKELKYTGFSVIPSDYECQDGEMAAAINLVPEDGALHPVCEPEILLTLPSYDYTVLFIHKTSTYTHYIIASKTQSKLWWIDATNKSISQEKLSSQEIHSFNSTVTKIQAVGNILIILADSIHYVIWKENKYSYLGTKVPNPNLHFPLKLNLAFQEIDSSQKDLPLVESGKRDPGTDDNTEGWPLVSSTAYRYSIANGDFVNGITPSNPNLNDSYITTGWKPFPSDINLKANVLYKLKWSFFGLHYNMELCIGGKKNDSDEIEPITILFNDQQTTSFKITERIFESSANYTSLYYAVSRRWSLRDPFDTQNCNIDLYLGTDNSDSWEDKVDYFMSYNETSFNSIMGMINSFVEDKANDKARFIFPFFIRYAVKLYDGTYSYVSPPALMVPNSDYAPAISYRYFWGNDESEGTTRIKLAAFTATIQYLFSSKLNSLWKGIIDGIDIFVSPPIWLYNQSAEYDSTKNLFSFANSLKTKGFGRPFLEDSVELGGYDFYTLQSLSPLLDKYFTEPIARYMRIASRSKEDIIRDIESISNFYKIASLSSSDIFECEINIIKDLKLDIDDLSSLQTRPSLSDDILQYQGFSGKDICLYSYNNRLHVCNSDYILPPPSSIQECLPFFSPGTGIAYTDIYIFVETEQGEKIVDRKRVDGNIPPVFPWFFYHYSKATKAVLISEIHEPGSIVYYQTVTLNLRTHPIINGAYWFSDDLFLGYPVFETTINYPAEFENLKIDPYFNAASSIYISEVNNPFIYRSGAVVSIGSGKILGICSAARPLSQGQFGQFPLYAFTDEGVWALELSSTGTYSARQPITRDVCINADSICPIDSAVLFTTNRGIMVISGSNVSSISDAIFTDTVFDITKLPSIQNLVENHAAGLSNLIFEVLSWRPSVTYYPFPNPLLKSIQSIRLMYDYPNQRILAFVPESSNGSYQHSPCYIYSLKSKSWGMADYKIETPVNSYPDAMAMNREGQLLNFSNFTGKINSPQLLVSRPFKLDASDTLKTIDTIIQRGTFRKGSIKSIIYGSRDLFTWHLVWSSQDHFLRGFRGTPYKYFRIVLICDLDFDESIYGASVRFTPRLMNQLR